jgi:hypothetical protein
MDLNALADLGYNNVYLSLVRSLKHYLFYEKCEFDLDILWRLKAAEDELLIARREIQSRLWRKVAPTT